MNKVVEFFYYNAPVIFQNLLVSAYGFWLWRSRYSKEAPEFLEFLKKTELYSTEKLKLLQEEKFVDLARHAIRTVPYYSRWASNNGINECDITGQTCIKRFPVISKDDIRKNPDDFISSDYRKKDLMTLSTSGTTGSPLKIWCDRRCRTYHYAFFSRLRSWFGISARSKRATLFGRVIMKASQEKPPFWRYDIAQRNLIFSSYHLSEKNIHHYYKKLCDYNPEEIIGYPSSLYQIALYVLDSEAEPLRPKLVICTAENLLDYQREAISKAFDAPTINQYGCTEMAFFASECEHGKMHFHPEHGIFEVLNERGLEVSKEEGRLIATGLLNRAMPLIRYDTGDIISVSHESRSCNCGRSFPVIEEIEGRVDDLVYRLDGTPVGRLDPIFKGGGSIIEAKVKQDKAGNIQVLVVPDHGFTKNEENRLQYELRKRVGADTEIEILAVDTIEREKNGKFRAVVSEFEPRS
ncbi:phenylacetate--CoA ligase family protein [Vreelandella utahensis]|uniref:phenylacetate--CoA ligase family protein n=1 Tax=Vreelandella halophila TaxID=86177 RepID=UPI00117B2419|nr:phenylacetate--CoA ligase family protein [Halomonas utahensis]